MLFFFFGFVGKRGRETLLARQAVCLCLCLCLSLSFATKLVGSFEYLTIPALYLMIDFTAAKWHNMTWLS